MKDVIEKIEKGKFPPSANNTSDYARGYNTAIEDAVEILQSITPSPSLVTWEEVKAGISQAIMSCNNPDATDKILSLIQRYPLHPPMEWVKVDDVEPKEKTAYWVYGEILKMIGGRESYVPDTPYYWKNKTWVNERGGELMAKITHYKPYIVPAAPLPPSPQKS